MDKLLARMDVGMGGRVAEELFFGNSEITTGCGSDLQNTTDNAYRMNMMYGMGTSLVSISDFRAVSDSGRRDIERDVQKVLQVE